MGRWCKQNKHSWENSISFVPNDFTQLASLCLLGLSLIAEPGRKLGWKLEPSEWGLGVACCPTAVCLKCLKQGSQMIFKILPPPAFQGMCEAIHSSITGKDQWPPVQPGRGLHSEHHWLLPVTDLMLIGIMLTLYWATGPFSLVNLINTSEVRHSYPFIVKATET